MLFASIKDYIDATIPRLKEDTKMRKERLTAVARKYDGNIQKKKKKKKNKEKMKKIFK